MDNIEKVNQCVDKKAKTKVLLLAENVLGFFTVDHWKGFGCFVYMCVNISKE